MPKQEFINKIVSSLFISYEYFGLSTLMVSYDERTFLLTHIMENKKYVDDELSFIVRTSKRKNVFPFAPGQWVRSNYKAKWMGQIVIDYYKMSEKKGWCYYNLGDEGEENISVRVMYDRRGKPMRKIELKSIKIKYLEPVEDPNKYILKRV